MDWEQAISAGVGAAGGILGAERGAGLDYKYGLKREAELWKRGQERGLTPQEYYGSPAPGGAANFSSGAGQTMGNAMSKAGGEVAQMMFQAEQKEADRVNAKDIAQIQADAVIGGQDKVAQTAANVLELQTRRFVEIELKMAAKDMGLKDQQLKKLIADTATAQPKFLETMKRLGMGTENMYVELMLQAAGVKSFEDAQKLSPEKFTELVNAMLAGASTIRKETQGVMALGDDAMAAMQSLAAEFGIDISDKELLKDAKEAARIVREALKKPLTNGLEKTMTRNAESYQKKEGHNSVRPENNISRDFLTYN